MEILIQEQVIRNDADMSNMLGKFKLFPPLVAAFDTETTGLSIAEDKPFLYQFGWYNVRTNTIYVGVIDLEDTPHGVSWIAMWHKVVNEAPVYLAHNVKFDMHMIANIDVPYDYDNISDSVFYIRFAHDNIPEKKGGVPLKLKAYCAKYVDPTAKEHDSLIQKERSAIAKAHNLRLKQSLGWTMKKMDAFFKDATNMSEDFPDVQTYVKYANWKESLPKGIKNVHGKLETEQVPYTLVDRKLLIKYAALDIVWVIKVFLLTDPVIDARGTREGLKRENECIRALWEMEREGFTLDKEYVQESYYRMRTYIRRRRQDLKYLTGLDVTANQNKVLLQYFQDNGLKVTGTDADILIRVHKDYPNHPVQPVVDAVIELRTLEKWFSTYLMRFLGKDKVYTQINQVGASSLRMSSDFQQFPKGGLVTADGKELFNPRRAVKVPDNADAIVYLDYSQIELRVQALYTILVGHPDLQLCRAYMPYKCHALSIEGVEIPFDYNDPECIAHAYDTTWYYDEAPGQEWVPTDVHGATTKAAFNIDEQHPDYETLRYLGKRVNFAKNYGAQRDRIKIMFPDYDDATIDAIDKGYYAAFPGVRFYQDYCYQLANYQQYATNLYGVRYWGVSGHVLINMLIQGSSATLLKEKIVEMHNLLKPYKTRMFVPIHDEVQFIFYNDELHLIPKLQAIMQDWDVYVPIVADAEITRTYWSKKEKM